MTDIADNADAAIEKQLEVSLGQIRQEKPLPYTGRCYNCDEAIEAPLRWCDGDCRDDYLHAQAAIARNRG